MYRGGGDEDARQTTTTPQDAVQIFFKTDQRCRAAATTQTKTTPKTHTVTTLPSLSLGLPKAGATASAHGSSHQSLKSCRGPGPALSSLSTSWSSWRAVWPQPCRSSNSRARLGIFPAVVGREGAPWARGGEGGGIKRKGRSGLGNVAHRRCRMQPQVSRG